MLWELGKRGEPGKQRDTKENLKRMPLNLDLKVGKQMAINGKKGKDTMGVVFACNVCFSVLKVLLLFLDSQHMCFW